MTRYQVLREETSINYLLYCMYAGPFGKKQLSKWKGEGLPYLKQKERSQPPPKKKKKKKKSHAFVI